MSENSALDEIAAAYEARVASVPEAARRFASETWGETWSHAEMGSLLDFAALIAAAPVPDLSGVGKEGACLTAPGSCPTGDAPDGSSSQATAIPSRGWSTMADCPSDGRMVWVAGGRRLKPELTRADGSWWRQEAKDPEFGATAPTHWHPEILPPALGTEAGTAETSGLGPKDEGPATSVATPKYSSPLPDDKTAGMTVEEIVKLIAKTWLTTKGTDDETADELSDPDELVMISPEDHAACVEIAQTLLHRFATLQSERGDQ